MEATTDELIETEDEARIRQLNWCPPAERLLIAIPSYDGRYFDNMVAGLFAALPNLPCKVTFRGLSRDPYIDRARNALVTEFLLGTDATDLLFLDADVGQPQEALARIASFERPFVAGAYPKKEAKEGFPVDLLPGLQATDESGLLEVLMAPTGFLRLNRKVFDVLPQYPTIGHNGKLQLGYYWTGFVGQPQIGYKGVDTSKLASWIGEDVRMAHLWRSVGGKIFIDPNLDFQHVGQWTWQGNFSDYLRRVCRNPTPEEQEMATLEAADD